HRRQQHRPLTQRNSGSSSSGKRQKRQQQQQRYRGQAEEDQDAERERNMPLAVPKAAFTVLDRFMAPETQTRAINWGVNFAAERPWMSVRFVPFHYIQGSA